MRSQDVSELDDAELLGRSRAGDRRAFAALIGRHQRAALRLAAVVGGSTDEAPDIVQEAFVSVYRNLDGYRGSGSVRSWMLRVVANQAKNHVRGRIRRLHRDDRHARVELRIDPGVEDVAMERDDLRSLAEAMGHLGVNDREVLACRYMAELTEAETADVLSVAIGTVKSRSSRALQRLRAEMTTTETGEVRP